MQLPQIRLQQTYAQIGLRRTAPQQEIKQNPAEVNYQQTAVELSIERTPARLEVDQDQAWNELGFKNLTKLTEDHVAYSRQEGMEAIAQIVAEGNQMAAIENKSDAIPAIAQNKSLPMPDDFNVAFIPSHGSVKLHFQPTELHLQWKKGGVDYDVTSAQVSHDYTPGQTEVYLRQRQQLDIDFVGLHINQKS